LDADLKTTLRTLAKFHGTKSGFEIQGSQNATDRLKGLPSWVDAQAALVARSNANEYALVDPEVYAGVVYGNVRVRLPIDDWSDTDSDYHFAIFKSYGAFDPRNPLAWRIDPMYGRGAYVRFRDVYPLANAVVVQRFGIGVMNRVGAALYNVKASGNYAAPTI